MTEAQLQSQELQEGRVYSTPVPISVEEELRFKIDQAEEAIRRCEHNIVGYQDALQHAAKKLDDAERDLQTWQVAKAERLEALRLWRQRRKEAP